MGAEMNPILRATLIRWQQEHADCHWMQELYQRDGAPVDQLIYWQEAQAHAFRCIESNREHAALRGDAA